MCLLQVVRAIPDAYVTLVDAPGVFNGEGLVGAVAA